MCRSIHNLHNFEPAASTDEVHAAALQYVRKIAGTTKPSKANQEAFDRAVADAAREMAAQAFEALGCEGLARVDLFATGTGLVVNEVNTMPGFTPFSMYPQAWAASGVSYPELVEELVQLALDRPLGLR